MGRLTSIEICAGAGGQALGLEQAGFEHAAVVDVDPHCFSTLRQNRPNWNVIHADVKNLDGTAFGDIDLLAGGLPCSPYSVAGRQLGEADERNLFPAALRLIAEIGPRAVLIENVRGLHDKGFDEYRDTIAASVEALGYTTSWNILNASDFGVPQLRPRVLFTALKDRIVESFRWPVPCSTKPRTVGDTLFDLMSSRGWRGAHEWRMKANDIAPTVVGGSLKHGGPDLGPTGARHAWARLGVDGLGIANEAPQSGFAGMPKLTVRMVARLQGFPDSWQFVGGKTAAYRQVGNAFPPPIARALGEQLARCLVTDQASTA